MSDTTLEPPLSGRSFDSLTFEEAFRELEAVVQRLEQGDLPLDESLELYERGISLARQCSERLDAAELRVRQLSPEAGFRELPSDEL